MYVLGIESTCDETAAAIVEDGRKVISNVISTSVKEQALYGGVVPEIASRRHAEYISATVDKALADANMTMKDVDAVAVTFAPGLIGAVLVGVNFAKGLAYAAGKPLVPVHHLRGHIAANYLTHQSLHPPFLCLVASGGHSHIVMVEDWCRYKVLGRTVDDAAGEAYDKVARTLGLPYPGGPSVLAGGVAANGRLRQLVNDGAQKLGARVFLPELKYCGDNGAMIAAQGYYEYQDGNLADWTLNGLPTLGIDYR